MLVVAGIVAGVFYYRYFRGVGPAIAPPLENVGELVRQDSDGPFMLPKGFALSVLTDEVSDARVIGEDLFGNIWVSRTNKGIISLLEMDAGSVTHVTDVFEGLNRPHGLAFHPDEPLLLYIAETDAISRVRLYSDGERRDIADLPADGRHFTRTIGFGPDGQLYVSIGSSCNVCYEDDARRAAIYTMDADGSNTELYASGLRNAVFFTWHPEEHTMWATEMGRDFLGDNLPPDEINVITKGSDYGWPICYGKNIHDTDFDTNTYIRDPCSDKEPSTIDIPAHSAPLGLAVIPQHEAWPEAYWHDVIVAYHGSWNRTEPTGYKLVRMRFDESGSYQGTEDFITGWLRGNRALGRPVDVHIASDGMLYVSDDKAGVIYAVRPPHYTAAEE